MKDEDTLLAEDAERLAALKKKYAENPPIPPTPTAKQTLIKGETVIEEAGTGMAAVIPLARATSDPMDKMTLVAFLPPDSTAKILDLAPLDDSAFTAIDKRLDDSGRFASFTGTPQTSTNLSLRLSVSQPTTAMIQGSGGIQPFKLELRPQTR